MRDDTNWENDRYSTKNSIFTWCKCDCLIGYAMEARVVTLFPVFLQESLLARRKEIDDEQVCSILIYFCASLFCKGFFLALLLFDIYLCRPII